MILNKYYPDAVVSNNTALIFHHIYNYIAPVYTADVPYEPEIKTVGPIRFQKSQSWEGITEGVCDGVLVKVYSRARSAFEILLACSGEWSDPEVVEVVESYLRDSDYKSQAVLDLKVFEKHFGKKGEDFVRLAGATEEILDENESIKVRSASEIFNLDLTAWYKPTVVRAVKTYIRSSGNRAKAVSEISELAKQYGENGADVYRLALVIQMIDDPY